MFSFAIVGSIAITKLKFVNKVGAKYKGMESLNLKSYAIDFWTEK